MLLFATFFAIADSKQKIHLVLLNERLEQVLAGRMTTDVQKTVIVRVSNSSFSEHGNYFFCRMTVHCMHHYMDTSFLQDILKYFF